MANRECLQDEGDQRISNVLALGLRLGCITEEQKLKVEIQTTVRDKKLQLFEFLESMEDEEKASRLLIAIRYKEVQLDLENFNVDKVPVDSDNNNSSAIKRNAILLCPVIRCIFKYLNLADLKNCRYVCPEWNSVAQPILRSRSKIEFPKDDGAGKILLLPQFLETFSETLESLPFTAFELKHIHDCPLDLGELNDFFQRQQKTLRELKINVLHLTDRDPEILRGVDVTPWIIQSPIAEESKHHTKFEVFTCPNLRRVIVQNCALANVKELILANCQINLEDKIKCRPAVLKLNCVAFFKNGIKLQQICVNDYFDFSRLEYLELRYLEYERVSKFTKLFLNMKGKLKLDYLILEGIAIVNWGSCSWEVNKFEVLYIDFMEKTEMQIQELDFLTKKIDICCLPQYIKSLRIDEFTVEDCFCSRQVIFPTLQSLALNLKDNSFSIFSEFVLCPTLANLYLKSSNDNQLEINSDWIPLSVKVLTLQTVSINWTEERNSLNLDKLVLVDNPVSEVKKICSALNHIKELHVSFPVGVSADENIFNFFLVKNSCDRWKTIVVGPFEWEDISFETSSLRHLVDRKSRYYTIEHQIIKASGSFCTFRE